jgi:NAD(P)-dependent dehydrogenase (short-subunit alcohol dehydrogenase family)
MTDPDRRPDDSTTTWLVTGVSRGIGRAIGEAVLASGHRLVGTVRKPGDADDLLAAYPDKALIVQADITDKASVDDAVAAALAAFGRIDLLVNNAGYTLLAGIEEATEAQIHQQFETNTFGLFRMTRAVLPTMRSQGAGRIIMVSSVAGVSAAPGLGYYAASKHAVEGFSESLAKEVAEHGIKVTLIEPGLFRTNTLGASLFEASQSDAYAATVGKTRAALKSLDGHQPGDPAQLAAAVLKIASEPSPPLHLPLDPGATGAIRPRLQQQLEELDEWAAKMATASIED